MPAERRLQRSRIKRFALQAIPCGEARVLSGLPEPAKDFVEAFLDKLVNWEFATAQSK